MEKIGDILTSFFRESGIEQPLKKFEAMALWDKVVGEKISGVTEPVRLKGGKLFIRVYSDVWRTELIFHKKEILKKLNAQLEKDPVQDIILL